MDEPPGQPIAPRTVYGPAHGPVQGLQLAGVDPENRWVFPRVLAAAESSGAVAFRPGLSAPSGGILRGVSIDLRKAFIHMGSAKPIHADGHHWTKTGFSG